MVRLSNFFVLALFSTALGLPAPLGAPPELVERERTITRTVTGQGGHTRTRTVTFTHPLLRTKTHSTRTKTHVPKTKTHVTKTKTHVKPTTHTKSPATTPTTTVPTTTTTSPTKTTPTTTSPTATNTAAPGTCAFFGFFGTDYTDASGVTYDVECGSGLAGAPYSTVNGANYGACFPLCDANAACTGFTWIPATFFTPAQCALYDVSLILVPDILTNAAILVSR